MRVTMSNWPPAENGTTILTGFSGYLSADQADAAQDSMAPAAIIGAKYFRTAITVSWDYQMLYSGLSFSV
jgi:hypothetical protein